MSEKYVCELKKKKGMKRIERSDKTAWKDSEGKKKPEE